MLQFEAADGKQDWFMGEGVLQTNEVLRLILILWVGGV